MIRFAIPAGKTATTMLPADIIDAINTAMAGTEIVAADPTATPPVAQVTLADQLTVTYNIRERAIQFKPSGSDFDDDISQIRVTGWNLANAADPLDLTGTAAENLVLGLERHLKQFPWEHRLLGAFLSDALVPNGDLASTPISSVLE